MLWFTRAVEGAALKSTVGGAAWALAPMASAAVSASGSVSARRQMARSRPTVDPSDDGPPLMRLVERPSGADAAAGGAPSRPVRDARPRPRSAHRCRPRRRGRCGDRGRRSVVPGGGGNGERRSRGGGGDVRVRQADLRRGRLLDGDLKLDVAVAVGEAVGDVALLDDVDGGRRRDGREPDGEGGE